MATKKELLNQLHSLQHTGFEDRLARAAAANTLPAPYLFAIASRETNCINELGDSRGGEFHGVGIIQIDIQHSNAREARDDGSWRTNPQPLIDFGARLLAQSVTAVKSHFPAFTDQQHLKIAASGYNCGVQRAIDGANAGDSDKHTTGHDYGRDVMNRMAIFEELIAER
jgi:hypothetical protein